MADKRIALVLGSGGARGLAHIGAIRCLEERGVEISYISGCSIGALIGGIYAAGKLEIYADWVSALRRRDIIRLLDWSFSGAMFKGERIIAELRTLIGDLAIENLDIGYTAVATALNEQREVWFNQGPLWDAIRASMAVPLIFAPVERDGVVLVDGGVINPLPIAPAFNSPAAVTVAVDLNAPAETAAAFGRTAAPAAEGSVVEARADLLTSLQTRITRFIDELMPVSPRTDLRAPGAFELVLRTMDAMQTTISRMKLAAYTPQVVVPIPRNLATFFEFDRAEQIIRFGYERTAAALEQHDVF